MASEKHKELPEKPPNPGALHWLLEATPHRLGELVAFADSIPIGCVEPFMMTLVEGLKTSEKPAVRRRKLIILSVLVNRMVFEIESIPKDFLHVI